MNYIGMGGHILELFKEAQHKGRRSLDWPHRLRPGPSTKSKLACGPGQIIYVRLYRGGRWRSITAKFYSIQ